MKDQQTLGSLFIQAPINTDLPTSRRCPTYLVRQQWHSLRLPIHQNRSFGIFCCRKGDKGSVHPIQRRYHIEGIEQ